MATTIEFTHEPHPLAAKAGIPEHKWRETFRFRWWALFLMWNMRCHPALGYISAREVPNADRQG